MRLHVARYLAKSNGRWRSILAAEAIKVYVDLNERIEIFQTIRAIQQAGTAVLLVEQDAQSALSIAERAYVLEHGCIVREGRAHELTNDDDIRRVYLGL